MLKQFLLLLISFCTLSAPLLVHAETKVLTAEGTYTMGEGETMTFAESMALQKAKLAALEQAGTYVESYTKVQNYQLTADEIQTIAGGVLQVEVLDKARTLVGDGLKFLVKIKATVATDKIADLAQRIKGKNVAEEYTKLQAEYARLSRELESWKQRAEKTPQGRERNAILDHIREEEKAFTRVQQRQVELFQRLVSGEQLVAEVSRDKDIVDGLVKTIVDRGYVVTVGEVKAVAVPEDSDLLALKVPFTVRVSEILHETIAQAVQVSGGTIRSVQAILLFYTGGRLSKADQYPRTEVRLVRLGKDRETAQSFQERVFRLTFLVTFLNDTKELAHCQVGAWEESMANSDLRFWRWSPVGRIVAVSRVHAERDDIFLPAGVIREVPDVYQNAMVSLNWGTEANDGSVAIMSDAATFVAQLKLRANIAREITGVNVRVILGTPQNDKPRWLRLEAPFPLQGIPRCTVAQ